MKGTKRSAGSAGSPGGAFITRDPETLCSIKAAVLTPQNASIMIFGQPGSGRTCLAGMIHRLSGRKGGFVPLNCAAYDSAGLEERLFGRRKRTGPGALSKADRGTLFLYEISALDRRIQEKLLDVLPRYADGDTPLPGFRTISAANDPHSLVNSGKLCVELLQRLRGADIYLKTLRERRCDIMPLIRHFSRPGLPLRFSKEVQEFLLGYDWPGNAREIKRFVDLASCSPDARKTIDIRMARKHLTWHFF